MPTTESSPRLLVPPTTAEFLKTHRIRQVDVDRQAMRLPTSFSIRRDMSRMHDQGAGFTCCSFGVASALEYVHGGAELSEGHLADAAARSCGSCQPGVGVSLGCAM